MRKTHPTLSSVHSKTMILVEIRRKCNENARRRKRSDWIMFCIMATFEKNSNKVGNKCCPKNFWRTNQNFEIIFMLFITSKSQIFINSTKSQFSRKVSLLNFLSHKLWLIIDFVFRLKTIDKNQFLEIISYLSSLAVWKYQVRSNHTV